MREYITFHQVTFNKENLGVKKLFGLNTNLSVGVQQTSAFPRNPRNSNQIEIPDKIQINEQQYNKFSDPNEAFEAIKTFIYNELKINEKDLTCISNKQNINLYFCFFDNEEETPKFKGVLYVTTSAVKPFFYVAFTKSLEFEYAKELYKK